MAFRVSLSFMEGGKFLLVYELTSLQVDEFTRRQVNELTGLQVNKAVAK